MNELSFNNDYQRGFEEFPGVVKGILDRIMGDIQEGISEGRANRRDNDYYQGDINLIPSDIKGQCHDILVGICYDKDHLEKRLLECFDLASKQCFGINREIYFITTQWNSSTVSKLKGYIESLRHNGVRINLIHITEKGFVLMPV